VTQHYVGGYYEWRGGQGRSYYYHSGQRVAMREGGVTTWLFGDHLGSTSVSYRSGGQTTRQQYYAWGTIRPGPANALPTDCTFTGQKLDERSGLMYYVARWYDPALGRFLSPDSIVPSAANPQDLNRFSYVRNNPVKYVDPTGHFTDDELLHAYRVFAGPNQLAATRDSFGWYGWYYMLRAADLGDMLSADVAFGRGGGSRSVSGELKAGEGMLLLETAGGELFQVTYRGLSRLGGLAGSLSGPYGLRKPDGTYLWDAEQTRRYVQQRESGEHPITVGDFHALDVGWYLGIGGHASLKRDRFGRIYVGLSVGIGLRGLALGVTRGNLPQDYTPDQGQIDHAIGGWGVSVQGGFFAGGGISATDYGPVPVQYGYMHPGLGVSVGYSWQVWP
jgi:RHS repeat-associated protein